MTTGTFVLNLQQAKVFVLALAHACLSYAKDAFAALAFEPQLFHQPTFLSSQMLYFFSWHLPTVTANFILWDTKISLLFLHAEDFFTAIAHHRVACKAGAEGADEVLDQLGFISVDCVVSIKSFYRLSLVSQPNHSIFYLQGKLIYLVVLVKILVNLFHL